MLAKIIIFCVMFMVIISLGAAMKSLVTGQGSTVKALTWRIGLSLTVFGFLLVGFYLGWLTPHGLG